MTVGAAILCPAVYVSQPMRMARMCVKSIKCVTSQPFFCSSLAKSEPTWLRPGKLKFEAKMYFLTNVDKTTKSNKNKDTSWVTQLRQWPFTYFLYKKVLTFHSPINHPQFSKDLNKKTHSFQRTLTERLQRTLTKRPTVPKRTLTERFLTATS